MIFPHISSLLLTGNKIINVEAWHSLLEPVAGPENHTSLRWISARISTGWDPICGQWASSAASNRWDEKIGNARLSSTTGGIYDFPAQQPPLLENVRAGDMISTFIIVFLILISPAIFDFKGRECGERVIGRMEINAINRNWSSYI